MLLQSFTHRCLYTHNLYAQTLLHADAFTHRCFYTHKLQHTGAFIHRCFHTQKRLRRDTFTHTRFDTQILLHTDDFTHRCFYTQTLLHANPFTHTHTKAFTSVFNTRPPFRAKGLRANLRNRNFTTRLDIKTYESEQSAAQCVVVIQKVPFTSVLDDRCKIAILRSNLISCERVVAAHSKSQFHLTVFGDRTSFRAKGLRFVPSCWHCPAPEERNRKGKRGKWAREQEGKRARG